MNGRNSNSTDIKIRGCVSPLQVSNVIEQLGGLDGLDLDKDLDILDGYDELTPEAQEKVKQALIDGHVSNEDWKGVCLTIRGTSEED